MKMSDFFFIRCEGVDMFHTVPDALKSKEVMDHNSQIRALGLCYEAVTEPEYKRDPTACENRLSPHKYSNIKL